MFGIEELAEAAVTVLRADLTNFAVPGEGVRVMATKRVPPVAGNEFIAVRPGTLTNTFEPGLQTARISHELIVGLTTRVQGVPNEYVGENLLTVDQTKTTLTSMLRRANEIANILDNNQTVITTARAALPSGGGCFYDRPLGFSSMDAQPEEVYEDHFDLPSEAATSERYVGLYLEIVFSGPLFYR